MRNLKVTTHVVICAIALLAVGQLQAQQERSDDRKGPPSFEKLLEKMDKNDDGKLSEEEIKGPLKRDFAKVDLNEDGYIDEEEFEKAPKPKRPSRQQ